MLERSSCNASFGNVKISDLDFADDTVIFAGTLDILKGALEALNEESELLGLWVSWVKNKIQVLNDILEAPPKDYLAWSLFNFVFLNGFCLGYSRDRRQMNDPMSAAKHASTARALNITATILSIICYLTTIIVLSIHFIFTFFYWGFGDGK
uniref:Uncharacterized protein n=1 Tax=Eptatretus burgeri TaxID=7764 RepID=A0A8C4R5K8_EPTBU